MPQDAYVGVPDLAGGKKVRNVSFTLPAGTAVTNADGTTTTLTSATAAFVQVAVLSDDRGNLLREVVDYDWQDAVLGELQMIRQGMNRLIESFGELAIQEPVAAEDE